MLRLRHEVFKSRLGWRIPARDGIDFDEFDVCQPYYLLAVDDFEKLVGCWRMLPTSGPYMLSDVFPQLLGERAPPRSEVVWEGSRFAVHCGYEGKSGLGALSRYSAEIFCGVVEFALAHGITEVLTVYDRRIARLLPRLGVESLWVSAPVTIDGEETVAGCFRSDRTMLAAIRNATGITRSVIRRPAWPIMSNAA
jgi:acyl homoserine lactone synthase